MYLFKVGIFFRTMTVQDRNLINGKQNIKSELKSTSSNTLETSLCFITLIVYHCKLTLTTVIHYNYSCSTFKMISI